MAHGKRLRLGAGILGLGLGLGLKFMYCPAGASAITGTILPLIQFIMLIAV